MRRQLVMRMSFCTALAHVVDGGRGHLCGDQGLHLHAGLGAGAGLGLHVHDVGGPRRPRRSRPRSPAAADGTGGSGRPCAWPPGCRRCARCPAPRPWAGPCPTRRRMVAGLRCTSARTRAMRTLSALPVTSTMRARPCSSRCVKSWLMAYSPITFSLAFLKKFFGLLEGLLLLQARELAQDLLLPGREPGGRLDLDLQEQVALAAAAGMRQAHAAQLEDLAALGCPWGCPR